MNSHVVFLEGGGEGEWSTCLCLFSLTVFCNMCYMYSGWKSRDSVPKLVDEYLAGKLKVDEFITHSFPLDKVNEAFELMHAGKRLVNKFCVELHFFILILDHLFECIHGRKEFFISI